MNDILTKVSKSFKRSSRIPFEHQQQGQMFFERFKKCIHAYDVVKYVFYGNVKSRVTKKIFSFCFQQNLYIDITLKCKRGLHAVVLVAEDTSNYFIKNSWNAAVTKVKKVDFFNWFDFEGEQFTFCYENSGYVVWLTYKKSKGPAIGVQLKSEDVFYITDSKYEEWLDIHQSYKKPRECTLTRKLK
jgi:hypothetical protein